ncbi:MAG: hypothetical protein GX556_00755 [Fibrobacter sp.]|nr:hypothetical protein [Fibrobacter sp.]
MRLISSILFLLVTVYAAQAQTTAGLDNADWGATADEVREAVKAQGWQTDPLTKEFPESLKVTVFRASSEVAGYRAIVRYYFWEGKFFQSTVVFNFDKLKNFDFNYNVFRSVNEYYTAIRSSTLVFVRDIYDLLQKKYGKKEPIFKGLDPRMAFVKLDSYVRQERWNLRYHPYDYYTHIVTSSYARWDFPKTRVIFSVNLSAPEKRFDYQLSSVSLDLERQINKKRDELLMKGL